MPAPPYLVLLRAGFCLPPTLPPARCALTAPFHPYSPKRQRREDERYIFCATGPSSCPARALPGALPCGARTFLSRLPFRTDISDRLADCEIRLWHGENAEGPRGQGLRAGLGRTLEE